MKENNKIKNEMTKVPKTKDMNDRDYLNDVLETEKNMAVNMAIASCEASNEKLFTKLTEIKNDIMQCQRTLFELVFSKGWYTLEESEDKKTREKHKELKMLLDELNNRI